MCRYPKRFTVLWSVSLMEAINKLLGMLGLARRAGRLSIGTDMTCEALRQGSARLCILACDASENTAKRVKSKSEFYGVKCICPEINRAQLSHAIGKENDISAVAINDENFASAIENIFKNCEERTD